MDNYSELFITPEKFEKIKKKDLSGPNGWLLFVACNSGIEFANAVKNEYADMLAYNSSELKEIPILGTAESPITTVFADTETCPRLPKYVAGSNAYVFQCVHQNTSKYSVNENIQQLLQVVRTLRSHRAKTITVVTPYSPYSRQDKPTFMKRESTLARLFADQLKVAGANIYLAYHPHSYSLYGFYEPEMMFVALSGLDLFMDIFQSKRGMKDVVAVSTDAGGAKMTIHFSEAMNLSYAIASKFRKGKDSVNLLGIIGDLEGKKTAIVMDDETVTGSSILNAIETLYKKYGIQEIYAVVSHMKMKSAYVAGFKEAHEFYGLKELHITDSIPQPELLRSMEFVTVHSLARRFAASINRLHYNQSLSVLFY